MRVLAISLCCLAAVAQDAPSTPGASGGALVPEQAALDVRHYDLTLAVDPEARSIDGHLEMVANVVAPLRRIVLHLDDALAVRTLQVDGVTRPHLHRDGLISAELAAPLGAGDELRVRVVYGGRPRIAPNPPWSGGFTWSKARGGKPWIATTCQGEGADLWWPCKDHPSDKPESFDLRITVPGDLVCASNGVLKSDTRNDDGTRCFHWQVRQPISNYGIVLNIAPYEVLESSFVSVAGETVPVFFWVLPESVEKAKKALPEFIDHLRFFEELLGPYPFRAEKYGIAETPHLGMEHQTIIAYGNRFQKLQRFNYDWLHHHEASHEWWGNLVTCRDWKDMWIHEGFGTYMQALYIERTHGAKGLQIEMASKRRSLRNRKPVAPRGVTDSREIYFGKNGADTDIYFKGSWILHTLRWLVGDDAFLTALRRMAYPDPEWEKRTDGSQVRFVDTEEFRHLVERLTERELGWFFELYLRQPALPELVQRRTGDALELAWKTPNDLPFPLPVPVRVDGVLRRIEMPEGLARVALGPDAAVEIDPDAWILRTREPRRRARRER